MDIDAAYALLAELELRDVEDLGADWFDAELADQLELARAGRSSPPVGILRQR